MANPFDQFDAAPTAPTAFAAPAAAAPNPFDQFDAPKPANDSKPESSWLETGWDTIKQLPSAFEKAGGGLLRAMGDSGASLPVGVDMGPNDPETAKVASFNAEVAKSPNSPSSIGKLVSDHAEQSLIANAPNVPAGSAKHYANMLGVGIGQMAPALLGTILTRSAAPILAQTAAMSLGTNYADAINATPNNPDAAFSKAASLATVDTAAAAISIKAFGIQPFTSAMGKITNEATGEFATVYRQTIGDMIKNVMVQGIAIQPAIAVVNRGVDNWINGRPITEGFGDEYVTGAIQNTLLMGITHLATKPRQTLGKVQGGEPGPGFGEGPIIDGNVTPPGSGPAPAAAPIVPARRGPKDLVWAELGKKPPTAPIDPQDIHPGDEESPIPTHYIAAGRKIVREATAGAAQASDSAGILARNGWPPVGSRVTLSDGELEPVTGTVHSGFSEPHPDAPGTMADGLQVALNPDNMLRVFGHVIQQAGITITPEQAQMAGLPPDVATAPANQPQAQTVAATPAPAATATQPEIAPAQVPPQPASSDAEIMPPILRTPAPETTGDGTQSAPIVVTHPDHLTQASDLVNTAPTEAQKEAGNYTKGHIKVQGLNITIENPAGSVRSGTGPEGPWSVKMPAAYGYVKRTTGADGEQVDVYVGPNPQSSKIFVVDQKDAQSGAFDEHKVMLGMDTKQQALDTYHAAFSDGLGPQRMGGVREMNTIQFKKLLNSGVLDKPVSGGKEITLPSNDTSGLTPKAASEEITPPTAILKTPRAALAPSTETSVLENIRRMGGIKTTDANGNVTKEGQDILAVLKDVNRPGLINNQTGQRPDTIREHMQQHGWFGQTGGHDIQDLYDLIDKETRSGPQFHPESERGRAVAEKNVQEDSERERADAHSKLDHYIKESKHLFSTSEKAAMHERVDGGFDPESALVEHIERNAVRGIYDRHEEAPDAEYAAAIPHQRGESETDSSARKGVERSAPETGIESGKPEDGVPTPVHPSEGPPEPPAEVNAEPGTAVDGQGKAVPQTVIPGADHSAAQLAAAREVQGHGRATTSVTQKDAGGMFAPKVEEAPDLFGKPGDLEPSRSIIDRFRGKKEGGEGAPSAQPGNEQVGIGADLKRMIDLFGPKMYGADMPQVTAKELLQNSFDGIKAALQRGDIKPGEANIDIHFDREARTFTITDNGAGMSPQIVKDAFLTVAGTDKGDLATEDRSGGFGIAKLAFIFGNDGLHLTTVRDGLKTTLDTNSKELLDGKADLKSVKTSEQPGTTVKITFPKEYLNTKTGEKEPLQLPYDAADFSAMRKPLIGDVAVNVVSKRWNGKHSEPLPLGRNMPLENMPKVTTAHFNWGDVDIYLGKPASKYSNSHTVLSSGLYQFDKRITTKPQGWEELPHDIILNVRPSVSADSPMYPFNNQREDFSPKLKAGIEALNNYLRTWHAAKQAAGNSGSFADVHAMPTTRKLNKASYTSDFKNLDLAKHLPDRGTAFDLAPDITIRDGKTSIGGKNRDFGAEMTESEKVRADKFSFPDGTVTTDAPLFHSNLNVDVVAEAASRRGVDPADSRRFLAGVGTIVNDFRNALAKVERYEVWADQPVGISLDKEYHGVHIAVPFKGFFLNPLSVREKTSEGIADSFIHTMYHEAAHTHVKDHSEAFTIELAKLTGAFGDANPGVKADLEAKLRDLLDREAPAFYALREVFNDATTTNAGSDAEGSKGRIVESGPTGRLSGRPQRGHGEWDGQGLREGDAGSLRESAGGRDVRGFDGEPQFSRVDGTSDEPLSERQFHSEYVQHVDLRGRESGKALETRDSILRDGFKKGANVNAMPPSRADEGGRYAPRKGDVVYLAPKGAWKDAPNGPEIQNGWKPKSYEAVVITDPSKSMYENYRAAFETSKPTDDHQAAIDNAWDTLISSTAKRMGWEGEPTSQAMGLKALLMPKGPEKTELARNARAIKALEDQRANPLGTRQAPIQGDGETKVRGAAQSMADKAAKSGIALEDLPTYDVSHQAPFIARSEKFDAIPTNRATAEAVAMGREPAPYGTTAESMLIAVERRANREGDAALLLKLATQSKVLSDLTTAGQRISMMQNLDPLSPVVAIKAVQAAREKAAKVKGGDVPKAKKDTIKEMMDAINKQSKRNPKGEPMGTAARKLKFKMFLNSVVCK